MSKQHDQAISMAIKNHTPESLADGYIRYRSVVRLPAVAFKLLAAMDAGGSELDKQLTQAIDEMKPTNDLHPAANVAK